MDERMFNQIGNALYKIDYTLPFWRGYQPALKEMGIDVSREVLDEYWRLFWERHWRRLAEIAKLQNPYQGLELADEDD